MWASFAHSPTKLSLHLCWKKYATGLSPFHKRESSRICKDRLGIYEELGGRCDKVWLHGSNLMWLQCTLGNKRENNPEKYLLGVWHMVYISFILPFPYLFPKRQWFHFCVVTISLVLTRSNKSEPSLWSWCQGTVFAFCSIIKSSVL